MSKSIRPTELESSPRKRRYRPVKKESYSYYSDEEDESSTCSDDISEDLGDRCQRRPQRQLMRPWLIQQVEKGDIPGLEWVGNGKDTIRVPWTHASRHGWDAGRDSCLFKRWAIHTGRYKADDQGPETGPKKWKANFRCAMNSLPDVREETQKSHKKGHGAFKIYKLMPEKKRPSGPHSAKKQRTNSESEGEQYYKRYTTNADRLEKTKVMKELKKKVPVQIMSKHQTTEQDQRVPEHFSIPKSILCDTNSYSDDFKETKPNIVTSIPKCTESSWASQEDNVARTEEVPTTPLFDHIQEHKLESEHSYARSNTDNIPRFVAQEDATSDYNSNSDVDELVQSIVELENNSSSPSAYGYRGEMMYSAEPCLYQGYAPEMVKRNEADSMEFSMFNNMYNPQFSFTNTNMNNSVSSMSLLDELEYPGGQPYNMRELNFGNY